MYTIKIDIHDTLYDKVMQLLKNIPAKRIVVEKKDEPNPEQKENIVNFFQSSPLVGEISIERDKKTYTERVTF